MIFKFSTLYPYLSDDIEFCFHKSNFVLKLPIKIGTVKKKKSKLSKEKKYCVKFKDSWCSKFKFILKSQKGEGFALCIECGSGEHAGENNSNSRKDTLIN